MTNGIYEVQVNYSMIKRIQNFLISRLKNSTFSDDMELYLYMILTSAAAFCLMVHVVMFALFSPYGYAHIYVNDIVHAFLFLFCMFLVSRRKYSAAGLMISLIVVVYSGYMSILTGSSNFVVGYYLLVIVMQIIIPYSGRNTRICVAAIAMLSLIFSVAYSHYNTSYLKLDTGLELGYYIANIAVTFLGTTLLIVLGNFLQGFKKLVDEQKIKELLNQAHTDPLTGLYNRRYADAFFENLSGGAAGAGYSVAMIDIDDFKQINDTLGHKVGDEVLRFLSDLLKDNLRKSDLIVRWGGEEFLVVLYNTNKTIAYGILEKIRKTIEQSSVETSGGDVRFTVTIGVSELRLAEPQGSIEKSDKNLYIGKNSGKNVVIV